MAQEKECKKCKHETISFRQIGMIVLGFYLLFASIYGTIQIFKQIVNLFSQI
jgi:hypothetical protein